MTLPRIRLYAPTILPPLSALLVGWLLVVGSAVAGDEKPKPLTNADVIRMLENKIPESVILTKILASEARFDTSTDAIIRLNNAGVSEKVLNAMVSPKADSAEGAKSPVPNPSGAVKPPDVPAPPPASNLRYGGVTGFVKKGVTTQLEIYERFGAADVTTTDKDGIEVWMYDKTTSTVSGTQASTSSEAGKSEASAMAAFLGIPFIAGVGGAKESSKSQTDRTAQGANTVTRTSKTITFIIKFNEDKTVKDYAVRQANY